MPRGIPNETRAETTARARKERVPFGVARQKMAVREIPGYFACWINDVGDRINQAIEGGYEFTDKAEIGKVGEGLEQSTWVQGQDSTDTRVSMIVGKHENGSPLRAYLMKIKQEFRVEDMAERQKAHDEIDASLRGGNINGTNGQDGRYIPSQGIKIS